MRSSYLVTQILLRSLFAGEYDLPSKKTVVRALKSYSAGIQKSIVLYPNHVVAMCMPIHQSSISSASCHAMHRVHFCCCVQLAAFSLQVFIVPSTELLSLLILDGVKCIRLISHPGENFATHQQHHQLYQAI